MDRMLFIAMTGANHLAQAQEVVAHNLANATTTGYKADRVGFSHYLPKAPLETRAWTVTSTLGHDLREGPLEVTGRDLDVAVKGSGFVAVRDAAGNEAYLRSTSLKLGPEGTLLTDTGLPVLSEDGPLVLPAENRFQIGADGAISAIPETNEVAAVALLGRIKLVDPAPEALVKGADGLFRLASGEPAPPSPTVQLTGGTLEGSNVSVVRAMTDMINLARQFDLQVKLMQAADTNEREAARTLSLNG